MINTIKGGRLMRSKEYVEIKGINWFRILIGVFLIGITITNMAFIFVLPKVFALLGVLNYFVFLMISIFEITKYRPIYKRYPIKKW